MSTLAWLDYSAEDKKRAASIAALFAMNDTRDELGLSAIRDGLADSLFPGTTTLMTRARYFLFVPWAFKWLESKATTGERELREKLRDLEDTLRQSLTDAGETGVIGARAGKSLNRWPSSIYWNGLRVMGILRENMSLHETLRDIPLARSRGSQAKHKRKEEQGSEEVARLSVWDAMPQQTGKLGEGGFSLLPEEAEYLRLRLRLSCPNSMLCWLAMNQTGVSDVSFAWEHEHVSRLPEELAGRLEDARLFSLALHGASLLYNYMLATMRNLEDTMDEYQGYLSEWDAEIESEKTRFTEWDVSSCERMAAPGLRARSATMFARSWINAAIIKANGTTVKRKDLQALVQDREVNLKHGRARLVDARRRELWSGNSGAGRLDFRWRIAQDILNDIFVGRGGVA